MSITDDHSWWKRRVGTRRQHGSIFGGYYLQRNAAKEELEEHIKSLWWGKDVELTGAGLCAPCLQGAFLPQMFAISLTLALT